MSNGMILSIQFLVKILKEKKKKKKEKLKVWIYIYIYIYIIWLEWRVCNPTYIYIYIYRIWLEWRVCNPTVYMFDKILNQVKMYWIEWSLAPF